ncbi:MAG: M28 family metallopeptidase [Chryseolinea sp.]
MKSLILFFSAFMLMIAYNPSSKTPDANDGLSSFSASRLEGYIKTLSSDDFTGRKPFTEGETKTVNFLESELKKIGLEPGNNTSYRQNVPLVSMTCVADSFMTIKGAKSKFNLKGYKDYVLWTQHAEGASLEDVELVFAGYGVVAPEYNWNDYEGIDVKGKVVVVFVNDPGFGIGDSTFFKGNTMTYYGRWTFKFEEAARQGAKGCLVIHDDVPASYPFAVVQNNWNSSKLYLGDQNSVNTSCAIEGWISLPALKKLFDASGFNYAEKLSAAHKNGFRAEAMNLKASTKVKATPVYNTSGNVVAQIEGSTHPDEYIIYSAHWDHLGIGKADEKGDSIYNGAMDNGTGTAGLLELANVYMSLKTKPERTVVFLFVTAEEQGLLGSAYYAAHPIFPKEKTVANINIDGLNIKGKVKDISLIGIGQSDLEDYLKQECEKINRYTTNDPLPSAGYYFRSDHFHFAKIGIPALYTHSGIDLVEGGKEKGEQLETEYRAKHYHQPSDEFDPATWQLDGSIDDLKLLFMVGKRLSMESSWPQWKVGSEFKAMRASYMK